MGFKSKGVAVETIVFNGRRYNRYPESDNPPHSRYFARSGHRLHRDVWVHHNGPIPEGMHIHHIDGNTANNDISNLACVTRKEHWDSHREEMSQRSRSPEHLAHLERIRSSAAEWHRSPEGLEWHRKHAERSIAKTWGVPRVYEETAFNCVWCGKEAMRKSPRRTFCGTACQSAESKFRLGKTRYQHPHHAARLRSDG
jgi:hypothetical protein